MASIFLSYAREDSTKAARIAQALEAAGHSVWWDRHIGTGSRFSAEIDEALRNAELVVVLWSQSSVQSAWVLDEAAVGRDGGRLVPVLIDEIQPPLGFRQFQALALTRTLRGAKAVQPLLDAVAAGVKGAPPPPAPKRASFPSRWAMIAIVVLLAVAAAWLAVGRGKDRGARTTIAVIAAKGGDAARSRDLARTIASDLGQYRAGPLGALTVVGSRNEDSGDDAEFRVEVGVSEAGTGLRADVSLQSPKDSHILWTTSVEGPTDRLVDLRQQAVAKLGDVLACAVEADSHSRKLSRDVLGLYLTGCSLINDLHPSEPDQETLSIFRRITDEAPDFAPGWGNLALIEGQSFPGTAPSDRPALRKALIAHLARAKKLDPTYPATIAAEANFHPNDGTKPAHAFTILDRGLAVHPDSARLHDLRAYYLRAVGRQNEGVIAAQRAMRLNPLSPTIRDSLISALAYSGRIEAAYIALAEADAIWPGSTVLKQARYRLDLRYGDPRAALRQLRERGAGDLQPVPMDTAWQAFLEARIAPSRTNVETALDGFRARYRADNGHIASYLQALGTFGRVSEAYAVVWTPVSLDSLMAGTEALFRTHNRSIRADPRFIALAAKLGLLAYWEKSGVWPDFCREPQLPYDCRAEAAKLTPEERQLAKVVPA